MLVSYPPTSCVFGLKVWWLFIKIQYFLSTNYTFKSYKNMLLLKNTSHLPFQHPLTSLSNGRRGRYSLCLCVSTAWSAERRVSRPNSEEMTERRSQFLGYYGIFFRNLISIYQLFFTFFPFSIIHSRHVTHYHIL
jgi:hypothetical protein